MKIFVSYFAYLLKTTMFFHEVQTRKRSAKIGIVKTPGFVFLILYSLGALVFLFYNSYLTIYGILSPIGQTHLMFNLFLLKALSISFVFGLPSAFSTLVYNEREQFFLSLPLTDQCYMGAKALFVATVNIIPILISALNLFAVIFVNENLTISMVFWGILSVLIIPLIPVSLIYFIAIPLLRYIKVLRNRTFIYIFYILSIILFYLVGFKFSSQTDSIGINNNFNQAREIAAKIAVISSMYPPVQWLSLAVNEQYPVYGLIFLAVSFAVFSLCLFICSSSFRRICSESADSKIKKINDLTAFINSHSKGSIPGKSHLAAMFRREMRLLLREPVYMLNGPLISLVIPLVMAFTFFPELSKSGTDYSLLLNISSDYPLVPVLAGISIGLTASLHSLGATAMTRDIKNFQLLRSTPLSVQDYFLAKWLCVQVFSLVYLPIVPVFILLTGGNAVSTVSSLLIAASYSGIINIVELRLDLAFPKITWANPIAAVKGSMVLFFSIIGNIAIGGLSFWLILSLDENYVKSFSLPLGLILTIVWLISIKRYFVYSEKRFYSLEI